MSKKLCVVTALSQSDKYGNRNKLYDEFAERIHDAGAKLVTVDLAYGEANHHVKSDYSIQVRAKQRLFHKEDLLNIGFDAAPVDCDYVAWMDADIAFCRPDWVDATIEALQTKKVIQMFSAAQDLDECYEPSQQLLTGFIKAGIDSTEDIRPPGFAWAARREVIELTNGLCDLNILGSGDTFTAWSWFNKLFTVPAILDDCPPSLKGAWVDWQHRAHNAVGRNEANIGYVSGLIHHYWHGPRATRGYESRWEILKRFDYDPERDLERNEFGILQLRNSDLQQVVDQYLDSRI